MFRLSFSRNQRAFAASVAARERSASFNPLARALPPSAPSPAAAGLLSRSTRGRRGRAWLSKHPLKRRASNNQEGSCDLCNCPSPRAVSAGECIRAESQAPDPLNRGLCNTCKNPAVHRKPLLHRQPSACGTSRHLHMTCLAPFFLVAPGRECQPLGIVAHRSHHTRPIHVQAARRDPPINEHNGPAATQVFAL